jgi:predicted ArsR family transcriptional regulator
MTNKQKQVLELIKKHPGLTYDQYGDLLGGITKQAIKGHIDMLEKQCYVERHRYIKVLSERERKQKLREAL